MSLKKLELEKGFQIYSLDFQTFYNVTKDGLSLALMKTKIIQQLQWNHPLHLTVSKQNTDSRFFYVH